MSCEVVSRGFAGKNAFLDLHSDNFRDSELSRRSLLLLNLTYSTLRYAVILAMAYMMLPLHTIKLLLLTRDSELS